MKRKRELKKIRDQEKQEAGQEYQIIKDVNKIKRWNLKSKKKLMKMPKEMFEKYLESTKKNKTDNSKHTKSPF